MADQPLTWLTTPEAAPVIAAAASTGIDPNAIERLRREFPQFTAEQVGAAIHQSWLRARAAQRWGLATEFLLTTDGLEQATRPAVSAWHAEVITQLAGEKAHVVDLTCGLGFDAASMSRAGHHVTAIERDPDIAALAAHNLAKFGAHVECADAIDCPIPSDVDVVFVDPARRDPHAARGAQGQSARMLDPRQWSPSWDFLTDTAQHYRVVAKVAPGISDEFIETWDAHFVSADGDLVEALVTSGGTGKRYAVLLRSGQRMLIEGGHNTPATPLGQFLIVPDSALVRARALTWLADRIHGGLVHERIAWLTSDDERACVDLANDSMRPATVLSIVTAMAYDLKALKRDIAALPHCALTVMTRGVQLDVEKVRKQIVGKTDSKAPELVLAVFRGQERSEALLCRRL